MYAHMYEHLYDEDMGDLQDFTEFTMTMTNQALSFLASAAPIVSGAGVQAALAAYGMAKYRAEALQMRNSVSQIEDPFSKELTPLCPEPASAEELAALTPNWTPNMDLDAIFPFSTGLEGLDLSGQSLTRTGSPSSHDSGVDTVSTPQGSLKRFMDDGEEFTSFLDGQTRAAAKKLKPIESEQPTNDNVTVEVPVEDPLVPPEHAGPPTEVSSVNRLPDVSTLRLDSISSNPLELAIADKLWDGKDLKQATHNEDTATAVAREQKEMKTKRKTKRRMRTKEQLERCRQESARARERKKVERSKLQLIVDAKESRITSLNATVDSLKTEVVRMRAAITQRAMVGLSDPSQSQYYAKLLFDLSQSPLSLAQAGGSLPTDSTLPNTFVPDVAASASLPNFELPDLSSSAMKVPLTTTPAAAVPHVMPARLMPALEPRAVFGMPGLPAWNADLLDMSSFMPMASSPLSGDGSSLSGNF
ncbi:hypothetical protein SARC_04531 [Sphaeroforma arctica JP610]|uniref:BZIP domain-containing protein n=1 Tax=Sphaeroforma arctica JP610 TaxID=667725 RepID=A0A0L0G239_9EUKA|nr:hypothetical protein SARC_04531 [Sphaeroforma arctica JP610]KNC83197.1 hypothetical protein SARC_04531 [Sphaeroforma arctica JP610]|eukprot:XP_014157099.1 hypothetical protein SARC_04531 [Sphaeroforma arctica JP610]